MSTIIFHWVLLRSRWNEHLPINSDLVKWFPGSHLSSNTVYPLMFCSQWLIPEWVIARCQSQSRRRAFNLEKYRVSLRTNERTDMPFGSWMNNNINQRQLYLSTWWFTWARRWIESIAMWPSINYERNKGFWSLSLTVTSQLLN